MSRVGRSAFPILTDEMSPMASPTTTVLLFLLLPVIVAVSVLVVLTSSPGQAQESASDSTQAVPAERVAGTGRVETALAAARAGWNQADTIVLARADDFPDALAGGPLAAAEDAPLLLTGRDELHGGVAAEIERLGAARVVLLGAEAALSDQVEAQAAALGVSVERIGGRDRYATAASVLADTALPSEVVLASGTSFPDALAAGGLQPARVLLTGDGPLAAPTAELLDGANGVDRITVVGGTAVVPEAAAATAAEGRELVRLAGKERYATAAAITEEAIARLPAGPGPLIVATGDTFPDALAAGPLAARLDAPILLVPSDGALPERAEALLTAHADRFDRVLVMGGAAALPDLRVDWVRAAISGPVPVPEISMASCGDADFPCEWSDADKAAADRSSQLLHQSVEELRAGAPAHTVMAALRAEPDVAGVIDDGAAITFRVHGGLPTVVLTERAAPGAEAAPSDESQATTTVRSYDPAGPPGEPKRVLIVSPYSERWAVDAVASLEATFAERPREYGTVTVKQGQQAGVSTMQSTPSYDIVIIISHGASRGFAGRVASELVEFDPETGTTHTVDDFLDRVPAGVRLSGGPSDPPGEQRLYFHPEFFAPLIAANDDQIFYGSWCQSHGLSPYDLTGFPHLFQGTGSTFLGWTENVWVDFAGRNLSTFWDLMVTHGVEASVGHDMLGARDLLTYPPSLLAEMDADCGDTCSGPPPRMLIVPGDDHRARDVVETSVQGSRLRVGMDLEWEGDPGDGDDDALTDVSFLVEGVRHGTAGDAGFRLFLRGDGVPEEEIVDVENLTLPGDGTIVDSGEGHDDWLVTVDRIELGYDVTPEMVAPSPLEWEVRVGEDEQRYSAQKVANVRLPVGTVRAVHPDFLSVLLDGDRHPAEGVEGDGEPDATSVVLQVSDVDAEDVPDFTVEAEIIADALDAPVEIEEPLGAFDQIDERTYRYTKDIALDHDLRSAGRSMTIDTALRKDGEAFSVHLVTVELHAQTPSDCWIERTYSGTYEDVDGNVHSVADSQRFEDGEAANPSTNWSEDEQYLIHLIFGPTILEIGDLTEALPLGQTGSFTVPFDPDGGNDRTGDLQGLRGLIDPVNDDRPRSWERRYEGSGTLTVTDASFENNQLMLMDADYSATLSQENRSGQVTVEGSFHYTYEGCVLMTWAL